MDRRDDPKFVEWSKQVKERDNYTCQICNVYGVYLESHHIYAWDKYEELRYEISNGCTLCLKCHEIFHEMMGYGGNEKYQFEQFREISKILRKIAEEKVCEQKILAGEENFLI